MMLARIEPGPGGAELQTFECPQRDHTFMVVVEDPMELLSRPRCRAGCAWLHAKVRFVLIGRL
jgi:hypothetical protein